MKENTLKFVVKVGYVDKKSGRLHLRIPKKLSEIMRLKAGDYVVLYYFPDEDVVIIRKI